MDTLQKNALKKQRIAIVGASGRMGKMLLEAALNSEAIELVAALDLAESPAIGKRVSALIHGACDIAISENVEEALKKADCLIDFTRPEGALAHLQLCVKLQKSMVIGTTGFSPAEKALMAEMAKNIPIVFSPNMSVGVNVLFKLLEVAASSLAEKYDVEIIEAHHRLKADAPSGTALKMGEVIAKTLGRDLAKCAIYGREGFTGERCDQTIGFATVRGGDIVGDHTALFCGIGERVEISHKAGSRMPYAMGAMRAACFLADKKSGLFDMQDVLNLRD